MNGEIVSSGIAVSGVISPTKDFVEREDIMRILNTISVASFVSAMLVGGLLVGCSSTANQAEATSQPPTPSAYNIIDQFKEPSGNHVVLYCRNANLYVSKDGSREGSLQFFYKHEMCKGF